MLNESHTVLVYGKVNSLSCAIYIKNIHFIYLKTKSYYSEVNLANCRHLSDEIIFCQLSGSRSDLLKGNEILSVSNKLVSQMLSNSSQSTFLVWLTNGNLSSVNGSLYFKAAVRLSIQTQVTQPQAFRAIPHLDPTLHACLKYGLLRSDLTQPNRGKIEADINK